MSYMIRESTHTARKKHVCMASEWVYNSEVWKSEQLTLAELKAIVRARRNGWMIQPGQKYILQVMSGDDFYIFKAIPEMHAICLKYDLYEDA